VQAVNYPMGIEGNDFQRLNPKIVTTIAPRGQDG